MNETVPVKYKNPPVIEAVAEIVFDGDLTEALSDEHIANELKSALSPDFPTFKVIENYGMVFDMKEQSAKPIREKVIQFENSDGKNLLRIEKNKVSIHRLKPYQKWEPCILPMITKFLSVISSIFNPKKVLRLGLRYVNEIQINDPDFRIDRYFNAPKNLLSDEIGVEVGFQFTTQRELKTVQNSSIRVSLAQNPNNFQSQSSEHKIVLDIDVFSLFERSWDQSLLIDWLNSARGIAKIAFEESVSEDAKATFS